MIDAVAHQESPPNELLHLERQVHDKPDLEANHDRCAQAKRLRDFVPSPPGTDPQTCQNAFVVYVGSKAADFVLPGTHPEIQTRNLYTCSIGSFNLYTTADRVDCAAKTATMDFWMYNNMSRRSFGRFASHPAFRSSGMRSQYLWWNWKESVDRKSGTMRVIPRTGVERRW